MPNKGDEFHHFGWNAAGSSLSPLTGHAFRRARPIIQVFASRIYIVETKPDPTKAKICKIIEPGRLHNVLRPSALVSAPERQQLIAGPGIIMDCQTFESWAAGRSTVDLRPSTMTSGGTAATTTAAWPAATVRERDRAGGPALEQVWPSHPFLGSDTGRRMDRLVFCRGRDSVGRSS